MTARSVAIIGAGVSGLAAGVALARSGRHVRVFEANDHVGGCSANTMIEGFTFHDGALFLIMTGVLDAAFARLGLDRERRVPLRRMEVPFAASLPDGSTVTVQGGRVLLARVPGGASVSFDAEVEQLVRRWRPVLRLLTEDLLRRPQSMRRLLMRGWRYLPMLRGTVGAELRRAFRDEAVRAAMGGVVLYAGLAPDELPVASTLAIVALLEEGYFLPVGGMGRIPEELAAELVALGGEIHLGAVVERIRTRNRSVIALDVAGIGRSSAEIVLSTTSAMATLGRLVDPNDVGGRLRRQVASARLSHRAVGIGLGLRNRVDATGYVNSVLPMLSEQGRAFSGAEPGRWLTWIVPSVTVPELAPEGGSVVEMYCPVGRDAAVDSSAAEGIADQAIEALSRRVRLDIAVRRVRGPEQFRTDLHLINGALYGLSPAVSPLDLFPQRTSVHGLFLAGQTTYPGYGVGAATMSGVLAADEIAAGA